MSDKELTEPATTEEFSVVQQEPGKRLTKKQLFPKWKRFNRKDQGR